MHTLDQRVRFKATGVLLNSFVFIIGNDIVSENPCWSIRSGYNIQCGPKNQNYWESCSFLELFLQSFLFVSV